MPEADVFDRLREMVGGTVVTSASVGMLPTARGAYLLVLDLAGPVLFSRPALGAAMLDGLLVYVGSARGPGGLRARLSRHFRADKTVRWHVDELSNAATGLAALAVPGGEECALVSRLVDSRGWQPAMRGFGSSDCRSCPAHLLRRVAPTRAPA